MKWQLFDWYRSNDILSGYNIMGKSELTNKLISVFVKWSY